MGSLKDEVISDTLAKVQIVRMDRGTAKWWNAKKRVGELATFCGWYWIRGNAEKGPFHTRSAAIRDAYYEIVMGREAPSVMDSLKARVEKQPVVTNASSARQKKSVPLRSAAPKMTQDSKARRH